MEITKKNELSVKENIHKLLGVCDLTNKEDLLKVLQKIQDHKHPKLSTKAFFEFMKVAYQINDNYDSLATMLTAQNKIDWTKLAQINLHLKTPNDNKTDERNNEELKSISEKLFETYDINAGQSSNSTISSNVKFQDKQGHICNQNLKLSENSLRTENSKISLCVDTEQNILVTLMKTNLSDILHEGLLDSILPYIIPKPTISQPTIKRSITNFEVKKCNSLSSSIETKINANISHKEKEKDKPKTNRKLIENEVEIHVCDEEKNIKKNFHCPQKLLIQKMCYFADVTAGQKLEEIDISVHCDIVIFDWLMRWVKKDIIKKSEWPILEPNNVIPIMVSASFLQMEPLLENCLQYCHDNVSDILKTSTVLTCLDDNLLTRLIEKFSNEDVEMLKDKKDKIQSRLFCKLITSLVEVLADHKKGHYSSLATLFKCSKCGKKIIQSISDYVPCIANTMRIDNRGTIYSGHIRDLTWTLNDYIITLRTELRSWRKVYWRLWGDCHFLFCTQCNIYFPIHQFDWCCYHTELPQYFINEQQRSTPFPLGRYPCCSQRAYRFEILPNREGCRYREHIPEVKTQRDTNVLNIFTEYRDVIATEPPQLFFPEKITRLVDRDSSLQPDKLMCKDVMWWSGIELTPPRPKLGLLGKIWSGSGFRRSFQMQNSEKSSQKIHQPLNTTDTSSVTSSIISSDEDDSETHDECSSIDEESYCSEDSNARSTLKSSDKIKKQSKNRLMWKNNGRSWSNNLNVRHNQDNQRDFEEKATLQMVALLTKRVTADSSLLLKSSNKYSKKKNQLNGGTYTRLEAEFRDQLGQTYRNKNAQGKYFLHIKPNKS